MNIIFLDIDGVLCTDRSHAGHGKLGGMMDEWDREGCGMVKLLCEKFDFKLVISSTWRHADEPLLHKRLKDNGLWPFFPSDKEWRYTPIQHRRRCEEINSWLNLFETSLDVQEYYVLDDDRSCFIFNHRWIKTDMSDGFLMEHFERIYARMRKK